MYDSRISKGEYHERKRNDHDYPEKNQSGKSVPIYLSAKKNIQTPDRSGSADGKMTV